MNRVLPCLLLMTTPGACSGDTPTDEDAFRVQRERMVTTQIAAPARDITHPRVLEAMRSVPRHLFVPADLRVHAYTDRALPIGHDQTISQPYIVAFMTAALDPKAGEKVLEIGTGSGYQAAVLAALGAEVYSIEIVEPLGREAARVLRANGYEKIQLRIGDGYAGWPEAAPFDAIMVTCSPEAVPQPLVGQLRPGGRMIIPVGDRGSQELILLEKNEDGSLRRKSVLPVRFVPMTGRAEEAP